MGITITRAKFSPNDPFYPAFVSLADQTFGGKADAQIAKMAVILQDAVTATNAQNTKYFRQFGRPDSKGNFSLADCPAEDVKSFYELQDEMFEVEIDLGIDEPLKLIKRKKTNLSPFQAAALSKIITIVWPEDDGSDLDKVDAK